MLAGAMPDKVERLALIDGLMPYTGEAEQAPAKLAEALRAQSALAGKRKPVYADIERAVEARMRSAGTISREAAELLAERGLMPVPGGYTWRSDSRLTLPSPLRLTRAHALAFARAVQCPSLLVLAEQGLLHTEPKFAGIVEDLAFDVRRLPGRHHLHLDDEAGARAVADCFNPFFAVP
ncbi:hypothetical protein D3C80_1507790 [compost metagenome]